MFLSAVGESVLLFSVLSVSLSVSLSVLLLFLVALVADGDGEPFASFCASAGEGLASTGGFHPCPESVAAFALDVARLVGALHDLLRIVLVAVAETDDAARSPLLWCHR